MKRTFCLSGYTTTPQAERSNAAMVDRRHNMADALNDKRKQPVSKHITVWKACGYDLLESSYTQQ